MVMNTQCFVLQIGTTETERRHKKTDNYDGRKWRGQMQHIKHVKRNKQYKHKKSSLLNSSHISTKLPVSTPCLPMLLNSDLATPMTSSPPSPFLSQPLFLVIGMTSRTEGDRQKMCPPWICPSVSTQSSKEQLTPADRSGTLRASRTSQRERDNQCKINGRTCCTWIVIRYDMRVNGCRGREGSEGRVCVCVCDSSRNIGG